MKPNRNGKIGSSVSSTPTAAAANVTIQSSAMDMPAPAATTASTRICCRSSPVDRRNRCVTATAVESAESSAITAPIAMIAPEAPAKPSTPIGFTNRMPAST